MLESDLSFRKDAAKFRLRLVCHFCFRFNLGRRIGGGSTVSAAPAPLAQPRVTENRITFDWSRKLDSIENLSGLCEC